MWLWALYTPLIFALCRRHPLGGRALAAQRGLPRGAVRRALGPRGGVRLGAGDAVPGPAARGAAVLLQLVDLLLHLLPGRARRGSRPALPQALRRAHRAGLRAAVPAAALATAGAADAAAPALPLQHAATPSPCWCAGRHAGRCGCWRAWRDLLRARAAQRRARSRCRCAQELELPGALPGASSRRASRTGSQVRCDVEPETLDARVPAPAAAAAGGERHPPRHRPQRAAAGAVDDRASRARGRRCSSRCGTDGRARRCSAGRGAREGVGLRQHARAPAPACTASAHRLHAPETAGRRHAGRGWRIPFQRVAGGLQ